MGCLKLPYNQEEGTIKSSPLKICKGLEKKEQSVIFCKDYTPFGGTFGSYQRTASTPQNYLFNGNEWMEELSLYDFNARTYDPWAPHFLQVDPMAEERYWLSPYNFAQMNPVNRVDPSGMLDEWIPEVKEDGSVQYIAEAGDNIATFAEQFNLSGEQARAIFDQSGYQTEVLNQPDRQPAGEGDVISGESVANVTGSEVLKLDWQSSVTNDSKRIDQVLFAMEYSKSEGQFSPSNFLQNVPYFHDGGTQSFTNAAVLSGTTSKLSGSNQQISMTFNHRGKLPIRTYSNGRQQQFQNTSTGAYHFNFVNANGASRPIPQLQIRINGTSNMQAFTKRLGFEFQGFTNSWSPLKK